MQFEELAKSFTKKELPASEVELTGEIPVDTLAPYRTRALALLAAEIEMPGFRKGHVPEDIALKKVGEVGVLEEAVELFMRDFYPELVETHAADAVGRPDIRIVKLAPLDPSGRASGEAGLAGNAVGIVIHTTVYPKVTVPKDWKSLAGTVELETVPDILDAEVEEALTSIRRARAKVQNSEDASADGGAPQGDGPILSQISSKESAYPESAASVEAKLAIPDTLPALDDEFAKSLGNFEGVEDLKQKLRDNMKQEKEQKAKDARRGKIIDALIQKTELEVPAIFVDSELEKILSQMREDTTRFGLSFEDYLKRVEKTEAQVREEFRDQAGKRAKLQLVLNKLAEDEKIEADKDQVDTEMKHAMEHFPDARPDLVRIHIETVLRNEKTLQLLEKGE